MSPVVLDASACVDLLLETPTGPYVALRIVDCILHAPAHMPAEVLSALGRLNRAGEVTESEVERALFLFEQATITFHPVNDSLTQTWKLRKQYRLVDALYIQLATSLQCPLITTDSKLHEVAEVIKPL